MPIDAINPTLQDAIFDFIVSASGFAEDKVIWNLPGIKRPEPPYLLLSISSGPRKTGNAETIYTGTQDQFKYPFRKEITLTVNSYADSGWLSVIGDITNGLELPTKQLILRDAGIAILNSTDPLDLSELLETDFEGRGAVDIFLAYTEEIIDTTGEIESVKIDQTIGTFESSQTIN